MRVLVTGGAGHLGFNRVALLLEQGCTVRASIRSRDHVEQVQRLRALGTVEVVEADTRVRSAMDAALAGIDTDLIENCRRGAFRLGAPRGNFSFVDVRDCARAHWLTAERSATGRFIVGYDAFPTFDELVRILARVDPSIKPPLLVLPGFMGPALPLFDAVNHRVLRTPRIATPDTIATAVSGKVFNASSARARRELGWSARVPIEQSLRETVAQLRQA
mgnify:CR=1 FL=1